jgi:acyl-CoA thioesterase FadM
MVLPVGVYRFPLRMPREAFSARDAARAGDLWRSLQEVAVQGSASAGWPPSRYRALGSAFVVREMRVHHHTELGYGASLEGETWIADFRRGLLVQRELVLRGPHGALATATQQWAHVGPGMRPGRAPDALIADFVVVPDRPLAPPLPGLADSEPGPEHRFRFRAWFTAMDPLGHANHPAYVDWSDEAISVALHGAGADPLALQPVAEQVRWRKGVVAPAEVEVAWQRVGFTAGGDAVIEAVIREPEGSVYAEATLVRRLHGGGLWPGAV